MTAARPEPFDLEGALKRIYRDERGNFSSVFAWPTRYDAPDKHRDLAKALAAALAEPPDPAHAAAAARHLVECFPNCRIGKVAYSEGLSDAVADDTIPPSVVRFTCRRVRAEAKALPTLAEMRERMLAELRARKLLLSRLEAFPQRLSDLWRQQEAEAQAIADAARRHGGEVAWQDIRDVWLGTSAEWLTDRYHLKEMREGRCVAETDALYVILATGLPREAFEAAVALLPDLAAYSRGRESALPSAPDDGTPEGEEWDRQWPFPQERFRDRLAPLVELFRKTHGL